MALIDGTLIVLAVVLFFGLVVPEFFRRFQLPFATSLIIVGSILGPFGLKYDEINESLNMFGFLGASFLLLLAGFEVKHIHFTTPLLSLTRMTFFNSVIPFMTGLVIVKTMGYSWQASIFTGLIFIASAPTLIMSTIKMLGLERTKIGQAAESISIFEDFISLFLLTLLFKESSLASRFSTPIYLGLLISSVIILKMFLPEITKYFFRLERKNKHDDELEVRTIISLLLIILIIYSGLGIHPIIASFLVGFTLAELKKSEVLKKKLHIMGYGIFVPTFFFIVGMEIDLKTVLNFDFSNIMMLLIIFGLFLSKFISGFLSSKLEHFSNRDAAIFGSLSMSKLTTALSLTFAAVSFGIIDNALMTSIVIMSVISTVLSPTMTAFFSRKRIKNVD